MRVSQCTTFGSAKATREPAQKIHEKRPVIDILEEPTGATYASLITFARKRCDRFYLVWQEQFEFNDAAREFEESLRAWEIRRVRTNRWDGTLLGRGHAIVQHYRLDRRSAEILIAAVPGLYGWLSPERPEDITFYTASDECWLATISHETVAWFSATNLTIEDVTRNVPGLAVAPGQLSPLSDNPF